MRLPTGSKIALAMECQFPFTSGIQWGWDEGSNAYLDFGNANHDVSERALEGTEVNLPAIAKARDLSGADAFRLTSTAGHIVDRLGTMVADGWTIFPEVPLAFNVITGEARALKSKGHRDYRDKRKNELTCTLDFVAIKGKRVMMADWKTGKAVSYEGDTSWQMKFGSLVVARFLGCSEVEAYLLYVDEDGIRPDGCILDDWTLDAIEEDIRAMWKKLHEGPQEARKGSWCTAHYCPVLGKCPKTRAELAEVVSDDAFLSRLDDPIALAKAIESMPRVEASIKNIKADIQRRVSKKPAQLSNGKMYGVVKVARETVDLSNPEAVRILKDALGSKFDEAVNFTSSKAAIERAVGGKKKSLPILNALRSADAFRQSEYDKFCEFNPKSEANETEKEAI